MTTTPDPKPQSWDRYAHAYILGINEKNQEPSKFDDPQLQRIYQLGRGVGNPLPFESNKL